MQCVPLSAQQRTAVQGSYTGPVTCTSVPWTVAFGGCSFSGDYAGAPLVRTGLCPMQGGLLDLSNKFITSVSAGAFDDMSSMT